jgi:hypothetical protein
MSLPKEVNNPITQLLLKLFLEIEEILGYSTILYQSPKFMVLDALATLWNKYLWFQICSQLCGVSFQISLSFHLSVHMKHIKDGYWYTDFFLKFSIEEFYEKLLSQFNFNLDQTVLTTNLNESMISVCSLFLRLCKEIYSQDIISHHYYSNRLFWLKELKISQFYRIVRFSFKFAVLCTS